MQNIDFSALYEQRQNQAKEAEQPAANQ